MTDAPERIWAARSDDGLPQYKDTPFGIWWSDRRGAEYQEYIRADLAPQWQPIETAPKDGTCFIGWCPGKYGGEWDNIHWREAGAYEPGRWTNLEGFPANPTHWMMPLPPKGEKGRE